MGAFYPMVSHACHIPIVEVDPETGRVTLLKYYAVNDCGTIMNPPLVEGQIMGGIVQGIGAALMEEYDYRDDGTLGTPSLREYLIPTLHEVPDIVRRARADAVAVHRVRREGRGGGRPARRADRDRQRRRATPCARSGCSSTSCR